jgi:hypothetical protein
MTQNLNLTTIEAEHIPYCISSLGFRSCFRRSDQPTYDYSIDGSVVALLAAVMHFAVHAAVSSVLRVMTN